MIIAQVGPYPISPDCIRGGVESSVFGLTQELLRQHNVYVFDNPRVNGADEQTSQIYRYCNHGTHNEDAIARTSDIVRNIMAIHPDVVHIHGTGPISFAIYKALRQNGIQPMVTIHGLLLVEKKNLLRHQPSLKHLYQFIRQGWIECRFLRLLPHAIIDTGYLISAFKHYPVRRLPKLHVIPQGANERYYDNSTINDAQGLVRPNVILSVGSFGRRKSQLQLIRAFERLRAQDVSAQLWLCGIVAEQDYFAQIQSAIASSPYKTDIVLNVNLSQEQLLQCYHEATIFALHSQEESQGIVFAEAMAMGLPIVSTNVGGIPYVVEDGCGLLSAYGDVDMFANNMKRLLTTPELYQSYANAAIRVADKYRWSTIAERVIRLYQEVCLSFK